MKYKVVARTFDEVSDESISEITLETNSLSQIGAFIRERVLAFRENDRIAENSVERVIYLKKDDYVITFHRNNWDVEAENWLRKYDWF